VQPLHAQTDLYENAYSIVREATTHIVAVSPTEVIQKEKRVIEILDRRGADCAELVFPCDRVTSLKRFEGEVRDAGGTLLRKVKRSDLKRTEYSEHLATDGYYFYFAYTPPRYPILFTYQWEMKHTDGIIGYPSFMPQVSFNQSVEKADYCLETSIDNPCRFHAVNTHLEVQQQTTGKKQLTQVSARMLPAIKQESYAPSFGNLQPRIYFTPRRFSFNGIGGEMESWNSYGRWLYSLQTGRDQLLPEQKERLLEQTAHCTTPYERVEAVYKLLGETTRYVSIQLGIGGLQPAPADEVCRTGYGDCKGLSNYARAMLEALNIPATYVIIHTDRPRFLQDYVSANQANHVVLQVTLPGDTLWLECTDPRLPLGYVHHSIAGHDALRITPDGGVVCRLPTYTDSINTQINRAAVQLNADGSAVITNRQTSRLFQYEDNRNFAMAEPAKQNDRIRSGLYLTHARIEDIRIEEKKTRLPQLTIACTIHTTQYGNRTGKRLFIPINIFHPRLGIPDETPQERTHPVSIEYGYCDIDTIRITLPPHTQIESIPHNLERNSRFGTFRSVVVRESDNTLLIVQRLQVNSGTYSRNDYADFLAFRKLASAHYKGSIVLKREP
jgi:hypothetical protein